MLRAFGAKEVALVSWWKTREGPTVRKHISMGQRPMFGPYHFIQG